MKPPLDLLGHEPPGHFADPRHGEREHSEPTHLLLGGDTVGTVEIRGVRLVWLARHSEGILKGTGQAEFPARLRTLQ